MQKLHVIAKLGLHCDIHWMRMGSAESSKSLGDLPA